MTRKVTHTPATVCAAITQGTTVRQVGINLLYWHSLQEEIWLYFSPEIVHVRLIAIDKHYGYKTFIL